MHFNFYEDRPTKKNFWAVFILHIVKKVSSKGEEMEDEDEWRVIMVSIKIFEKFSVLLGA